VRGVRQGGGEHVVGGAALIHRRGAEVHRGRGDGVIDVGGGRGGADHQALEAAAADAGDAGDEAGGVAVDVLAVVGGNGERAGGGPIGNGDVALVGMDGGDA